MSPSVDESSEPLPRTSTGTYFTIGVSPGELLDRATISELKASRISDPAKRQVATDELARLGLPLRQVFDSFGAVIEQWRGGTP